ncbi:MAG: RNA polymerase sigma factor (sigma-70 family) [Flavobacteriales bacterium]|jgi:RNA polymerase sigma factor (sigma-70 family)
MEISDHLSDKAKDDYRLVQLALNNNDQSAYAELMKRYRESIYFMLLKMIKNQDDADDLTIEAFGKAFKKLDQYVPTFAFSTWLFRIASNNCIDFIRRQKMITYSIDKEQVGKDGGKMQFDLPSSGLDPSEVVIRDQKIELMHEVVDKLKPRYKRLVELRYFKELSYEEIADELQLPLGTVKAQLFRARDLLYNILKHKQGKI